MKYLIVKHKDGLVTVNLNRADKRNAFNAEMIDEITSLFNSFEKESDIRAVLIRGEGTSFCAGADLNYMKSMKDFSLNENIKDSQKLFEMFETVYNCSYPILTYVHGHVMGGGLGLVAVSDIVAAETETQFCFSEVKIGLVPAVISPFALNKMQPTLARELMLTGRLFTAKEAKESGLLQFHGGGGLAEEYLHSRWQDLHKTKPQAVNETKKLLRKINSPLSLEIKELTIKTIAKRRVSSEGQAGIQTLLERKK